MSTSHLLKRHANTICFFVSPKIKKAVGATQYILANATKKFQYMVLQMTSSILNMFLSP